MIWNQYTTEIGIGGENNGEHNRQTTTYEHTFSYNLLLLSF